MRALITGANGFIGQALAKRILGDNGLGPLASIDSVVLTDLALPSVADPRIEAVSGDLAETSTLDRIFETPIDVIWHLANLPGGSAEFVKAASGSEVRHAARMYRANVDATTALLDRSQAQTSGGGSPSVFVFASSIAVFGVLPNQVDDSTPPSAVSTYGTQKLIGELLVSDYTRRGWVDGRSPRLPGVLARPAGATLQLTAFLSDIIREVSAGRSYACPTSPQATTWACSLHCIVDDLIHAATVPTDRLPSARSFTLPALRFSMSELVDAIGEVRGSSVQELVTWRPDERIEAWFGRYPPLRTPAAETMGFRRDDDLASLVRRSLKQ